MLYCRDKMESEFLADASFECNNISVLSAMLRNMINMLPVHKTSVPYSHKKKYCLYLAHQFHTHKETSLQPL